MDRVLSGASSAMYVVRDIIGAIYGQPDDVSYDTTNVDR
jgi:penicillin-binding protein 2